MIELGDDMSKRKKVKVKWKNLVLLFLIFGIMLLLIKGAFSSSDKESGKRKTSRDTKEDVDERLVLLDNIDKRLDYFNHDFLDRYVEYKKKNPNLSTEQVIKNVNMNLDQEFYEYRVPARTDLGALVLVNKYYYLESDYVPSPLENILNQYALSGMQLMREARDSFEALAKAAKLDGMKIIAMSSYRSYDYQVDLYNRYANKDGKEAADTYSGRAGHSEHQTALAVDVYNGDLPYTRFDETEEYQWMGDHAFEYGFILRFPKDKENETGYQFESWHYRYVGVEAAKYIHDKGISFEEYYATIIKDWR